MVNKKKFRSALLGRGNSGLGGKSEDHELCILL